MSTETRPNRSKVYDNLRPLMVEYWYAKRLWLAGMDDRAGMDAAWAKVKKYKAAHAIR